LSPKDLVIGLKVHLNKYLRFHDFDFLESRDCEKRFVAAYNCVDSSRQSTGQKLVVTRIAAYLLRQRVRKTHLARCGQHGKNWLNLDLRVLAAKFDGHSLILREYLWASDELHPISGPGIQNSRRWTSEEDP